MPDDLEEYFKTYTAKGGKCTYKQYDYHKIYDALFSKFRGTDAVVVEMGIGKGGCLQMWKEYFGPKAQIWGLDYHDGQFYEEPQIKCALIDQESKESLATIKNILPKIDIFIDDASHIATVQAQTLEAVFPLMSSGGIYCCEDLHTNYRAGFMGGYKKQDTFIEYLKGAIDALHYVEDPVIPHDNIHHAIYSMTFYLTLVAIVKK